MPSLLFFTRIDGVKTVCEFCDAFFLAGNHLGTQFSVVVDPHKAKRL